MLNRSLSATYDAWSETYDAEQNPLIEIEEGVVRSLLDTIEFHDVLDAGTGTGRYALYLAEQGKQVAAVDCNEKMLAKAREKASARQLPIAFHQEDISNLSFEDSSFDLVLCALALAHIKNLTRPIQEFLRVLRGNGHLVVSDLHPEIQAIFGPDFYSEHVENEGPVFFPNYHAQVDDFLRAMKSAGAEIMDVRDISQFEIQEKEYPGALMIWAKKPGED